MKEILDQYRKMYRVTIIGNWTVSAVCVLALVLVGAFTKSPFKAIVISSALVLLALFYTVEFIIEPLIFKHKVSKAGGELLNSLQEKPASFTTRFFFGKTAVFIANWKIKFVDCGEIAAAELLRRKIRLTLKNGRILNMPFRAGENPAVLCAVLRSINGDIDFIVNGKHIDKVDKASEKTGKQGDKL